MDVGRRMEKPCIRSCVWSGEQGGEGQNDTDLTIRCAWNSESCEEEGWCDHVAGAAHFELCPVLRFDSTSELCQHVETEFRDNRRHGFWRHLRPVLMGWSEQRHQCTGWSIHVQDASG